MVTTTARPDVPVALENKPSPPEDGVLARLEAFRPVVRATAGRWARRWQNARVDQEDLAQEVALALWQALQRQPDMPAVLLELKANDAARYALRRGSSVDVLMSRSDRRRTVWRIQSLEVLMEDEVRWPAMEADLLAHGRRDGAFSPVEDLAVARVLCAQLEGRLTHRQRPVLALRLQQFKVPEISRELGISASGVESILRAIRKKAQALWAEDAPISRNDEGADASSAEPEPIRESPFATTGELARMLGLSRIRAGKLCLEGKVIGARRVGKRWLIPRPVQVLHYPRWKK